MKINAAKKTVITLNRMPPTDGHLPAPAGKIVSRKHLPLHRVTPQQQPSSPATPYKINSLPEDRSQPTWRTTATRQQKEIEGGGNQYTRARERPLRPMRRPRPPPGAQPQMVDQRRQQPGGEEMHDDPNQWHAASLSTFPRPGNLSPVLVSEATRKIRH